MVTERDRRRLALGLSPIDGPADQPSDLMALLQQRLGPLAVPTGTTEKPPTKPIYGPDDPRSRAGRTAITFPPVVQKVADILSPPGTLSRKGFSLLGAMSTVDPERDVAAELQRASPIEKVMMGLPVGAPVGSLLGGVPKLRQIPGVAETVGRAGIQKAAPVARRLATEEVGAVGKQGPRTIPYATIDEYEAALAKGDPKALAVQARIEGKPAPKKPAARKMPLTKPVASEALSPAAKAAQATEGVAQEFNIDRVIAWQKNKISGLTNPLDRTFEGAALKDLQTAKRMGRTTVEASYFKNPRTNAIEIPKELLTTEQVIPKAPVGARRTPQEVPESVERMAAEAEIPPTGAKAAAEQVVPPVSAAPPAKPPVKPPVTTGGVPPGEPPSFEQTRDKLIGLMKEAKPVRAETQALYHKARQQQAARLAHTFAKPQGEATLNKALGTLKGELPHGEWTPPAGAFSTDETAVLYNKIWSQPDLQPFERVNAGSAFRQLFSEGSPPTRSELALLERIFGPEFVDSVLAKRSLGQKAWEEFLGVAGIPRALKSTLDFSAPLRQGAMLVGQPKEFGGALKDMFKVAFSDANLQGLDDAIRLNPEYGRLLSSKLYIAPIGRAATLTQMEEAYAIRLLNKGKFNPIAVSQRAYIGFLNSLRSRTFYSYAKAWGDTATPEQYEKLATFITAASGRGKLGPLERAAPVVAQAFFSPRYFMSRLQAPLGLLADNPFRAGPSVSRVAARNLVAFVGMNIGLLSMLKASGLADVNLDPKSADFGKARIGNTRVDFFAGYAQLSRFIAMEMTGKGTSSTVGTQYAANRGENIIRFARSKLAPIPGSVGNMLFGRDLAGDEVKWDGKGILDQAGNLLAPMNAETLYEAVQEHGAPGLGFGVLSTFGVGVQTYKSYPIEWAEDLNLYLAIKPKDDTYAAAQAATKARAALRANNPDLDAKLFITGQVDAPSTMRGFNAAVRLMKENGISVQDVLPVQKAESPTRIAWRTKFERALGSPVQEKPAAVPTDPQPGSNISPANNVTPTPQGLSERDKRRQALGLPPLDQPTPIGATP